VFWFPLRILSETLLILRRIVQVINILRSSPKSCQILMKLELLSTDFRKILKYKRFLKCFHWDSSCSMRTDLTKLTVAFHNFADTPTNKAIYRFAKLMHIPNFRHVYIRNYTHTDGRTDRQTDRQTDGQTKAACQVLLKASLEWIKNLFRCDLTPEIGMMIGP